MPYSGHFQWQKVCTTQTKDNKYVFLQRNANDNSYS